MELSSYRDEETSEVNLEWTDKFAASKFLGLFLKFYIISDKSSSEVIDDSSLNNSSFIIQKIL